MQSREEFCGPGLASPVRLTSTGVGVLVGSTVLVAVGFVLGLAEWVGIGSAGLVALAFALSMVREAPHIEVDRSCSAIEVPRGSSAQVVLRLRGEPSHGARPTTLVETVAGESRVTTVPAIAEGDEVEIAYDLDTSRRGRVASGPLLLVRRDPLGLVEAERSVPAESSVIVRPRRLPLRFTTPRSAMAASGAPKHRRGTATVLDIREHSPSDDLRHIHWPATAHAGRFVVRHLADDEAAELVLVLDNRTEVIGDTDFEHAVEIVASLVRAAEGEGRGAKVIFTAGRETSSRGRNRALGVIDQLTHVERSDAGVLSMVVDMLATRGDGSTLIFVSGELSAPDLDEVVRVGGRYTRSYLVSVAATRRGEVEVDGPMIGVGCSSAEDFVRSWVDLR